MSDAMTPSYKVKILMVDDNERKLATYEAILSELGESLIKAKSGSEALEILLKHDICLVLIDVNMPGMDGFQLAETMRVHPRFARTPIIFISAVHIADLDFVKGYARGAVDYISVPINPELLRAKVSVFAELHRSTKQLEAMNAQLVSLSNRLLETQDNERRRIARELHDGLGQDLSYAVIMLDSAGRQEDIGELRKRMAEARAVVERSIQQIRSISYLLHPPTLEEFGLGSALTSYVEELGKRSGIDTSIEIDPPKFPRLKPEVETAIFRIIQESLANVLRHSEATKACVSVTKHNGNLVATIRDNGKGLPHETGEFRLGSIGVGISSIRQRATELGGRLRLGDAAPGTVIEVTIPTTHAVSPEENPPRATKQMTATRSPGR